MPVRFIIAVVMTILLSISSAVAEGKTFLFADPADGRFESRVAKCVEMLGANYDESSNFCVVSLGTDIHAVFMTDMDTHWVTRLPNAELGATVIANGDTRMVVYNPDFAPYTKVDLPQRIWCETFFFDSANGTLLPFSKSKTPYVSQ